MHGGHGLDRDDSRSSQNSGSLLTNRAVGDCRRAGRDGIFLGCGEGGRRRLLRSLGVGGEGTSLCWADRDGDSLIVSLYHCLDVLASSLDCRGDSTVETLKSHCSAHADEMAGNIFITFWNLSSAENGGVVPDTSHGTQLSDLTVVHECCENLWQGEAGAIGEGSVDTWTFGKHSNKSLEVWQHHL